MKTFFKGIAWAGYLAGAGYKAGQAPRCNHCDTPVDRHYNAWGEVVDCRYALDAYLASTLRSVRQ